MKALATGEPQQVETEGVRDNGSRFSVLVHAFPLSGPDGAVKGFVEVVEDITERKRMEEQTKQLQEHLQLQIERMPIGLIVCLGHRVSCEILESCC